MLEKRSELEKRASEIGAYEAREYLNNWYDYEDEFESKLADLREADEDEVQEKFALDEVIGRSLAQGAFVGSQQGYSQGFANGIEATMESIKEALDSSTYKKLAEAILATDEDVEAVRENAFEGAAEELAQEVHKNDPNALKDEEVVRKIEETAGEIADAVAQDYANEVGKE